MSESDATNDSLPLNKDVRDIWNRNAGFWDDYMGADGNDFHRLLVAPSAERLLRIRPGDNVLEIACGAGLFARRMAELGAHVVATDFSDTFIERARARCREYIDRIEFCTLDATDAHALLALGTHRFDAVVSNMALMDITDIQPVAQYYFHRPLGTLFAPFLAAGLVLDGLEEPSFDESVMSRRPASWSGSFGEIPPVLAVRFRLVEIEPLR